MLIAVIQVVGAQGTTHVVHQGNICRVIKGSTFWQKARFCEQRLCMLVALLGQMHLVRLLVYGEVTGDNNALTRSWISLTLLARQLWN